MPTVAESAASVTFNWRRLVDFIFPPRCGGCETPGSLWCETCQAGVRDVPPPTCARCGQPGVVDDVCASCRATPLALEVIRSMTLFDGRIRHAIHALKYRRIAALAEPLGNGLARFWLRAPAPVGAIMPVPLHPQRQRERGYNQAELLARRVERAIGAPLQLSALRRVRATAVQMTLDAAERRANVADAFACDDAAVRGIDVLLIDDVCTTGATLDACARALKQAGAQAIYGLTLARTG